MVQQELRKLSQWFWNRFSNWYDGGGENRITSKRTFEVEVFFSSQNIDFPFIWMDSWNFSFSFSLLFIYALSLEDSRVFDDIWGENLFFKKFFPNGLTWNGMVMTIDIPAVDAYSGMELCIPIWLNHDYGDGGVVDMSAVNAYSGVEICKPIFLGEPSK
jgi:hypothetical protein